jgi:hypothetical protein
LVEHFYKEALREKENTTRTCIRAKKTLGIKAKCNQVLDFLQAPSPPG